MSVSLCIPTWNRTALLSRSLHRLVDWTLPDEIIIIDDGSDDGCEDLCQQFSNYLPLRYIYHHNPGPALYTPARNIGIKEASCDIWLSSDPEVMFNTNVVKQLLEARERFPEHCVSAGTCYDMAEDGRVNEIRVGWYAPWALMADRQWLIDVGGFDEDFPDIWGWDDTDVLTRLRLSGHPCTPCEEIKVTHQWHPMTFSGAQWPNEQHFKNKVYPRDIVANQEHDWGVIRHR